MKTCPRCGEARPVAEFHSQKSGRVQSYCKPCSRAARAEWRRSNSEKARTSTRRSNLKQNYGLTLAAFEAMRTAQGDACAICRQPFVSTPFVDHCHTTGAVRALTCLQCNTMIGMARENPTWLRAGADYLDLHHSTQQRNID